MPNINKEFPNNEKDFEKYRNNMEYISNINEAFNQRFYGGSIFKPIQSIRKLRKNESPLRPNNLFNSIFELRNICVGYFNLKNVKVSQGNYLNIQILISDQQVIQYKGFTKVK